MSAIPADDRAGNLLAGFAAGAARILLPVLLALFVGGLLLWALDVDPIAYYSYVIDKGLVRASGLEASITRAAPLLLIGAGLIVAFRAGLWNLGVDGQFLLAMVCVAALAPATVDVLPHWLMLMLSFAVAFAVGAAWSVIPAFLKAAHGINEIISSLMMSFIGVSLANILIKIVFNDPATTVPQTETLGVADRLSRLGDSTVHWGVLIGVAAVIGVHYLMGHTSLGLKLQVLGANPRAAVHAGLNVRRLTFIAFGISAGLAGMGGAVDTLGVHGTIRADFNPAYGILVIPLVFLARFNGWGVIGFVFFFAVLQIGGESAARRLSVPNFFVLVLVSLLLLFLALVEFLDHERRRRRE